MASVATLSNSFNVMATCIGHNAGNSKDDDAKPPANGKMALNAKNSATLRRRRNAVRLCLMCMSCLGVMFVLLSLLSH